MKELKTERKDHVYQVKFVWGEALAPWATTSGVGRSGE